MERKGHKSYFSICTLIFLICWSTCLSAKISINVSSPDGLNSVSLLEYGDFLKEKQIIFRIKGERDAGVHMSLLPLSYNVIIGGWGNTASVVRRDSTAEQSLENIPVTHLETGIMSGSEFREFWISWKNDLIRVGKGHVVGQAIFLERAEHCVYGVTDIKIHTYFTNTVTWIFQTPAEIDPPRTPIFQKVTNCPSLKLVGTVTIDSIGECCVLCWMENSCKGFIFEQNKRECELLSDKPGNTTVSSLYRMGD